MVDCFIEFLFTVLIYILQIGTIMLAALLIVYVLAKVAQWSGSKNRWNYKMIYIGIVAVLSTAVIWWMYHPPILTNATIDNQISNTELEKVVQGEYGLYSLQLPLYPLYIRVTSVEEDVIKYTVQYFPSGREDVEYSPGDGWYSEWH